MDNYLILTALDSETKEGWVWLPLSSEMEYWPCPHQISQPLRAM
jgi:hypothetical protein